MLKITFSTALFVLVFISSTTFAKGSSGGGSPSSGSSSGPSTLVPDIAWIGGGAGNATATEPKGNIDIDSTVFGTMGLGVFPNKSRIGFVLSIQGNISQGKLDYDYTDTVNNVHYKLTDEQFTMTSTELAGGIQLRLINASWFHLYAEGGGSLGSASITYAEPAALKSQGLNYKASDSSVSLTGFYYEAGIDLIPFTVGLRAAGRYTNHSTDKFEAFGNQKIRYEEVYGYVAIVVQH